jgi:diketogulonate reductase-like aldo/keto reductase
MTVGDVTADGRARILADGYPMPILGLGVLHMPEGPTCVNAVRWALDLGYRHIDTAQSYGNEASAGRARCGRPGYRETSSSSPRSSTRDVRTQ